MNSFLEWVGTTPLSLMLGNVTWAIPTIQAVHIMAIAAVFTSALLLDMRIFGVVGRDQTFADMTRRFSPWVGWGVLVLLVTGLLLMVAEPTRAITNLYFQIKMAALLVVCAVTWIMTAGAQAGALLWTAPEHKLSAKLVAAVSLLLWAVIITAGRWIAYGP
jgi:hypothetical protein